MIWREKKILEHDYHEKHQIANVLNTYDGITHLRRDNEDGYFDFQQNIKTHSPYRQPNSDNGYLSFQENIQSDDCSAGRRTSTPIRDMSTNYENNTSFPENEKAGRHTNANLNETIIVQDHLVRKRKNSSDNSQIQQVIMKLSSWKIRYEAFHGIKVAKEKRISKDILSNVTRKKSRNESNKLMH